jgi:hypothetical protein
MNKDDCYVGMLVRVARSVEERSFGYRNCIVPEMHGEVGSGRLLTIKGVRDQGVYFKEVSLGWDWSWLEPADV